jgi:hypothetical protein
MKSKMGMVDLAPIEIGALGNPIFRPSPYGSSDSYAGIPPGPIIVDITERVGRNIRVFEGIYSSLTI